MQIKINFSINHNLFATFSHRIHECDEFNENWLNIDIDHSFLSPELLILRMNVPAETMVRVKTWCEFTWNTQKSFDEREILK